MDEEKINEITEQSVVEEQPVAEPLPENPRKKKRWLSNAFFVASIALSLYIMYSFADSNDLDNQKGFWEIISQINVKYLLLSVATLAGMILLDSLKYLVIMRATSVNAGLKTALTVGLLGKYYDSITPFSSGGQPMQIYYLHKKGLGGVKSSAVILIKFAFNMTMWLIICFCLMHFNREVLVIHVDDFTQRIILTVAGWVGFALSCAMPLVIIACVILPKITWAITNWALDIGQKLRLVKNKEALLEKGKNYIDSFSQAFISMLKRPLHSIILALLCVAEPLLSMMLPYFVVVAIGGPDIVPSLQLMLEIMTLNVYAQMSAMIVPTPGNSGAVESAFMFALTTLSSGALFWTVFSWRFLSYYSYIIIGTVIVICQFVKNNRKSPAKRLGKQ